MPDTLFRPHVGVGLLILRLALGVTFVAHGWDKLKNAAGFAGFLRQIHVPLPLANAWLVALLGPQSFGIAEVFAAVRGAGCKPK